MGAASHSPRSRRRALLAADREQLHAQALAESALAITSSPAQWLPITTRSATGTSRPISVTSTSLVGFDDLGVAPIRTKPSARLNDVTLPLPLPIG